ncbi:MAG: AAA family ATPase, partial [Clostridia bacterium]|nr:AAA family ATPase [Clostridia bacterium]
MKIKNIKINSYGTLKEKEINLKDNINIIYGKNESGKSTLLNFIKNIFYGISKNKNGKEISDYEKYLPWNGENFSGKIEYELEDHKTYEVYRDFNKKNPKVFNEKLEDISNTFEIDKKDGNQFFYEQTGLAEQTYITTIMTAQQEVVLDKQSQNTLLQRISNLGGTGDSGLSFQRVIERLNKKQLEEVGSSRTQDRPINLVQNRKKEVDLVLKETNNYLKNKHDLQIQKVTIEEKLQKEKDKNNAISKMNMLTSEKRIEFEKIQIKNKIKNENQKKIEEIEEQKSDYEKNNLQEQNENKTLEEKKKIKKEYFIIAIIFILTIIANILNFIFISNKIIKYSIAFFIPIEIIIIIL